MAGWGIVVPVSVRGMQNRQALSCQHSTDTDAGQEGRPRHGRAAGSQVRRTGLRQGTDCLWLGVFDGRGQGIFPHIDTDRCPFQYIASNQGPTNAGLDLMLQETP